MNLMNELFFMPKMRENDTVVPANTNPVLAVQICCCCDCNVTQRTRKNYKTIDAVGIEK